MTTDSPVRLGLRVNIAGFSLPVGVNALVGGMIGSIARWMRGPPSGWR